MRSNVAAVVSAVLLGTVASAGAQTPAAANAPAEQPAVPVAAQPAVPAAPASPTDAQLKQSRYQIGVMERVLEVAVEHGASGFRDRLQTVVPAAMLVSEGARVRGFRLDGYGVFFDVVVPDVAGTLPLSWSLRTLDQNDLGLESALKAIKAHIDQAGDQNLEQAFKRVELQVGPLPNPAPLVVTGARNETGAPAVANDQTPPPAAQPDQALLDNPEEAYRGEVRQALMDAMLNYSGPLGIGDQEWLTVAARRDSERPRLAPGDTGEARTMLIRINGADLGAFRAGRISRDDAIKRMEVRVF
jgi:hypothetical protein